MSTVKTHEQVENEYASSMGADLGSLFFALYTEVMWVHAKWGEYKILYGSGPETVEFLNSKAGFFFKLVQDSWWDDIILHISRLADPSNTFKKENLSLSQLPRYIPDEVLKENITGLINECAVACKNIREHRNKRLAHRDLQHANEPDAHPLEGISRRNIDDILKIISDVMNSIDSSYRNATVLYRHFSPISGSKTLLSHLRKGERNESSAH